MWISAGVCEFFLCILLVFHERNKEEVFYDTHKHKYTFTRHSPTLANANANANTHSHVHIQNTLLSHSTIRIWPRVLRMRSHTNDTKTNKQTR